MINNKKKYLIFRGDTSGECIITTIECLSVSITKTIEERMPPKMCTTFKIHCKSLENALECLYKMTDNCYTIGKATTGPITGDGVDITVEADYFFSPMDTLKVFFPECFLVMDIQEDDDWTPDSLELLLEMK